MKQKPKKTAAISVARTGYCIFADDIRTEQTGKDIFVGVYGSSMVVPALPLKIEKLFVHFSIKMGIEDPIQKLKILIESPGAEEALDQGEMDFSHLKPQKATKDSNFRGVSSQICLTQFEILQAGMLRVKAVTEREEIQLGAIKIIERTPGKFPEPGIIGQMLRHYAAISETLSANEKNELSREIMDVSVSLLPKLPQPSDGSLIMSLGNNKFKVFYSKPTDLSTDELPRIVEIMPPEYEYKISNNSRFGCVVEFFPAEKVIEEFSIFAPGEKS